MPYEYTKGLKDFLTDAVEGEGASTSLESKPIADLFPATTIMFGDLVGFTAWSSTREPTQVFTLLETIYHAFDEIAHQRRVYKVETVGDCYVAATGIPRVQEDHAVLMAKFARAMMAHVHEGGVEAQDFLFEC